MKKHIMMALVMITCMAANAQVRMRVQMNDGTTKVYNVQNVQSVSFDDPQEVMQVAVNGTTVDLDMNEIEQVSFNTQDILFRQPYTVWGATKEQTKEDMRDCTLSQDTEKQLSYQGIYSESSTHYVFANGRLQGVIIHIPMYSTTMEEISAQLQHDGYVKLNIGYDQFQLDIPLYASSDSKTFTYIQENSEAETYEICYYSMGQKTEGILFEEPYTIWYSSQAETQDAMSSWGCSPLFSRDEVLVYFRTGSEMCPIYIFEEDALTWTIIPFISSVASSEEVCNYLTTELNYKQKQMGEWTYYTTNDRNTAVFVLSATIKEIELTFVVYTSKTNAFDFFTNHI